MHSQYDHEADALYITLTDAEVARTVELDPGTLVDVDRHGAPVGVEVLRPAREWPEDQLLKLGVDPTSLRLMLELRGGGRGQARFAYNTGRALVS